MYFNFATFNNEEKYAPKIANKDDACYDLSARCYCTYDNLKNEMDSIKLGPNERCLAKTGVFLALEQGWEALIRPRSGNALKLGLTVLNTPGTIDAGYRNEIGVILYNAGKNNIVLEKDLRIAQMCVREIPRYSLHQIKFEDFSTNTARGLDGFGSTGI